MANQDIESVFFLALEAARNKYIELGASGLLEVAKNQFGETALRMDIEAEEAVIGVFKKHNVPARIISEEHEVVDVGIPEYLVAVDGIDGTDLYKQDYQKNGFGTMLVVFSDINPKYTDYLYCGIAQHAKEKVLYAKKDHGAFVVGSSEKITAKTSVNQTLSKNTLIYIDEYWDINKQIFSNRLRGYRTEYHKCSAMYYADLVEGNAGFVLECTRKKNLEIAVSYGLVREAGGVTVDLSGKDIGSEMYLAYGQDRHLPIITAANDVLAKHMVQYLHNQSLT